MPKLNGNALPVLSNSTFLASNLVLTLAKIFGCSLKSRAIRDNPLSYTLNFHV